MPQYALHNLLIVNIFLSLGYKMIKISKSSPRALYKLLHDTVKTLVQPGLDRLWKQCCTTRILQIKQSESLLQTSTWHSEDPERHHKSMLHNRVLQIKQSEGVTDYNMIYWKPGYIATRTQQTANLESSSTWIWQISKEIWRRNLLWQPSCHHIVPLDFFVAK